MIGELVEEKTGHKIFHFFPLTHQQITDLSSFYRKSIFFHVNHCENHGFWPFYWSEAVRPFVAPGLILAIFVFLCSSVPQYLCVSVPLCPCVRVSLSRFFIHFSHFLIFFLFCLFSESLSPCVICLLFSHVSHLLSHFFLVPIFASLFFSRPPRFLRPLRPPYFP